MAEKVIDKNKEKVTKIVITIVLGFLFLILIIIKLQSASFPFGWVIFGFIALLGGMIAIWKGSDFFNKLKGQEEKLKSGDLPPAITLEQAAEFIEKQLKNPRYADYSVGWKDHWTPTLGEKHKQTILIVQLEPTYYSKVPYQFFILNMHYPETKWAYAEQDKLNKGEILRIANKMPTEPSEDPDIKVTEEESPYTGVKRKITEKIQQKKQEEKKEEPGLE